MQRWAQSLAEVNGNRKVINDMIYFRQQNIAIESPELVEKLLNRSTSKMLAMFEVTSTSTYVILEERPFIGQKLKNGETIVSRCRHAFFKIVPRIVSRWKIESTDGQHLLVIKNRLGLLPTIVLLLITLPLLIGIVKSVLTFEPPSVEKITYSIIFLAIFMILTKYELRQTDKTISSVINNEKVKSLITI